ncbi:MAG: InlB B-repeat-containing protein, partial [Clostridia bacterium]|nr:InlB B-repeat-containing protein [Clostridia bacterium]
MKRVLLFCLLILAALILGLSSCGKAEYNLTFVVDGKLYATVKAVENEPVKAPDDPEKDGYTFGGWYFDNGVWQMPFATDQPISGEVSLYAKWLCIHAPTDLIIDTAPTCKNEGVGHTECSKCKEILEVTPIDKLTTHTPAAPVTESFTDSTCSAKGSYDLVVYCSACDALISTEKVTVEKKPHREVTDPAIAPTCTSTGLTAGVHCSVCREVLVAQATVPALAHTAEEGEYKAPTCTDEGFTVGTTCSVCGEVLEAKESIPATGHTYNSLTTPPTCTENGYTTHACHCGFSYVDNNVDALGHSKVTVDAVAPTCTKAGLTLGIYCSECDTVLIAQTALPALGHTERTDPAIAPTCTTTGLTAGVHCSVCGEVLEAKESIP